MKLVYFDDIGRVAIPKEVRAAIFGNSCTGGKAMEVSVKDGSIILKPYIETDREIEELTKTTRIRQECKKRKNRGDEDYEI